MEIKSYIENNKKKFLDELFELIRIPSISAIKEYDKELRKAATFLKNQFEGSLHSITFKLMTVSESKYN